MFLASPFPLTLSLLSACLVSALTIPSPDGVLDTLEPFVPIFNHTLSTDGVDPKHYVVPGTEVWIGIEKAGGLLDQDGVLDIIDRTYAQVAAKPEGRTMNQDNVRAFTVQFQTGSYYFEVYRIFPPQPIEWEWVADLLQGLRTVMTLPAEQGGIGVRSIEFVGGEAGGLLLRGWIGLGRPPRPPIDAVVQNGTVAATGTVATT